MPRKRNILDSLKINTVEWDQPHAYINDPNNQAGRRIDATIHSCKHCDTPFKRASQLKSHENSCSKRPTSEKSGSESDYQPSPAKQPKLNRSLPKPARLKSKQPPIKSTSAEHPIRPESYKSSTHIDELKKNSPSPNTPPKSPHIVGSKEPATPSVSETKPLVSESQSVSKSVDAATVVKVVKKAAKDPKEIPIDNSDEALAETKKFKAIPIRAKLLTDLPDPPHLDRYPNHIHYMLFISIPKFTDREFLYELLTKIPQKDNTKAEQWDNIWWGDGTRHEQRKYRSSKKEPVPFVDDEEMVQQTFSYYFREGHFEKMRVRVHFNGEVREAEADV